MFNSLGYNKNLYILPFDHRSSLAKMFGFDINNLNSSQKETITHAKEIIYEGFKKAVSESVSKEYAAILVEEEYGDRILKDAINQGYTVILTVEKSGTQEFSFEYGDDFGKHIEKYKPTLAKALIRYKPNADYDKLRTLSDYCHNRGYKFLLEVLTPNKTEKEALEAIKEFQSAGIEPDVWKLEGMENEKEYQNIVSQAQSGNRQNVKVVILGRGANQETVEKWITVGAKVKGIIGFAVGRTVFWNPLKEYKDGKITEKQAVEMISNKYIYFYNLFTK